MQQPPTLDYDSTPSPQGSRAGCLIRIVGVGWIMLVGTFAPIGADQFSAPLWMKWGITLSHLASIAAMFYPLRKPHAAMLAVAAAFATLISGYALIQLFVLWSWN